MKTLLITLGILSGCSLSGEVIQTLTTDEYRKEWIDTNMDDEVDLIKTYRICNGNIKNKPIAVYDIKSNTLFVQEHLAVYSQGTNVRLLEGDSRCRI